MKVITIVGARPQFIKAAAVSRAFAQYPNIKEIIVHTGQHYDANMSEIFFEEMQIPKPGYNLNINGLGHGAMTGQMIEAIEKVLIAEKPDWLLVYGDTNSTLAGALAAKKLHIKVAHNEAGLRSYNMKMPEEINRILTDRISDVLFCPTQNAVDILKQEGFDNYPCTVLKSGDVMQDAAMFYAQKSAEKSTIIQAENLNQPFALATLHREENTNDPAILKNLIEALNTINQTMQVVMPLHPRTRKIIAAQGLEVKFKIIDPVGYFDMIELLKNSSIVLTDSGGLQKEAFFFQKQCITLREQTEWVELVEHGFNEITGSDPQKIQAAFERALQKKSDFSVDLYGGGTAAHKVAEYLLNH
jgi:UDP-GlcNAc3NAcA epimerase